MQYLQLVKVKTSKCIIHNLLLSGYMRYMKEACFEYAWRSCCFGTCWSFVDVSTIIVLRSGWQHLPQSIVVKTPVSGC